MALIKCTCCGHMVSDKGTKCPKCGTPIIKVGTTPSEEKEDKEVAEVVSPQNSIFQKRGASVNTPNNGGHQRSKKGIMTIVCIILLVVAAIVGGLYMWQTKESASVKYENDKKPTYSELAENVAEVNSATNIDKDICQVYINTINYVEEKHGEYAECEYFLYDITMNGIPELWIKVGSCEADYRLLVYTYDNGIKNLYEESAGHSGFYMGENYVLQVYRHMNEVYWMKLTYDGTKIDANTIFEEEINFDNDEWQYTEPKERWIQLYSSQDKHPIYNMFAAE